MEAEISSIAEMNTGGKDKEEKYSSFYPDTNAMIISELNKKKKKPSKVIYNTVQKS